MLFLIMAGLVLSSLPNTATASATFYVAPNGNDRWSGTVPSPTRDRSDGPFKTIEHAREAVRAARSDKSASGPITIYLRGGTYALSEPLVLGPEDSGTAEAPVTWAAYRNERPVLSAGVRITGWTQTKVNDKAAWVAKLPENEGGPTMIHALWINGQRMGRARWPIHGTLSVVAVPEKRPKGEYHPGASGFEFKDGDLKPWDNAADGEVITTNRWTESHLPIASIDSQSHIIHFTRQSVFLPEAGDPYWIENIRQCLTEPGSFYVDSRKHEIYLIPPTGTDPNSAQIIAPRFPQVMQLAGDVEKGHFVEHIIFRGLSFFHTEWDLDEPEIHSPGALQRNPADASRSGYGQAAIGVPGAVWGYGARSCTFDHCNISHDNTYGIELARGCQHNLITHCTFSDLGAGAVKIGETSIRKEEDQQAADNEVADCALRNGGYLYPSCVAVWIGQSHDNRLLHNEIAGFYYTAISVGWTWGYGPAIAQRNLIEYNDIHHIGTHAEGEPPILSDMGGIYTLGNQEGTQIRFNRFHDIAGLRYGGWGIYFDEGTTHILAENNLVYRTTHGGFHQHYGKENIFRNNIIAFGRDNQVQRTRLEDHTSFTFERNIVLWDEGVLLTGNWGKMNAVFDHNTYWYRGKGDIRFANKTFEQRQQAGMDEHSKIADPYFASPMEGDFRLTEKSKQALAGFEPFDLSSIGPRP